MLSKRGFELPFYCFPSKKTYLPGPIVKYRLEFISFLHHKSTFTDSKFKSRHRQHIVLMVLICVLDSVPYITIGLTVFFIFTFVALVIILLLITENNCIACSVCCLCSSHFNLLKMNNEVRFVYTHSEFKITLIFLLISHWICICHRTYEKKLTELLSTQ